MLIRSQGIKYAFRLPKTLQSADGGCPTPRSTLSKCISSFLLLITGTHIEGTVSVPTSDAHLVLEKFLPACEVDGISFPFSFFVCLFVVVIAVLSVFCFVFV